MDTLRGSVERVTYYNPENGYSVLRLRPESSRATGINRDGLATVTGNLPEVSPGEYLSLQGQWITHPKHGLQFQVEICEQTLPANVAGIRRYLGSGLIKGIGPRLAERIVAQFGKNTLDVIENKPELLKRVPDIGPKRSRLIAAAWEEQRQVKEIMIFLHGHGVSTNLAVKVYKQYGDQSLQVVQSDPYRLARDIYGVGFITADKIAQALGLPKDHPSRIEAGLVFTLDKMVSDGHVYLPRQALVAQAAALLSVDEAQVIDGLDRLKQDDRVRSELLPIDPTEDSEVSRVDGTTAIYLTPLYYSEIGTAKRLRGLASALPSRLSDLPPAFVTIDPNLSEEQQAAIRTALSQPVSVLTGGPGTGKTTALRALITALESAGKTFALASPTGRAAKRLSQATGRPASTIHRLLAYSPKDGFKHNAENPLKIDMLVIDEASMLDIHLANHMLKAIPIGAHLLLVGDVDQLPPVGAGDVLRDVIKSQAAPVTRLSVIFRQAAYSHIITNAHRINSGEMPQFPKSSTDKPGDWPGDFFLFSAGSPEESLNWMEDVVCNRIPKTFGLHPRNDIQVLAPMYRGAVGVTNLNLRLQAALNPLEIAKVEKNLFGQTLRPGDKLMQLQNNYDKDVYNGDIGSLFAIDFSEHTLTVDFEGRAVRYDWNEADQLVLAYAISVHKAQGSEFPAVVVPVVTQHYLMLQRNLLYTAITRATKLCVLVGDRRAIGIAVSNDKVSQRNTALDWRLST